MVIGLKAIHVVAPSSVSMYNLLKPLWPHIADMDMRLVFQVNNFFITVIHMYSQYNKKLYNSFKTV